ncbi:VOC family protein [Kiloniella antarctica]|uniref:VOC family protein n=1 Tax=Kiloniella antarctica TaxID=1550907 RepID=A0ABW5BN71_9PROT
MSSSPIDIDHIFIFVDPLPNEDPVEALRMQQAGFIESYRRDHPGQGTTNICYCFDNAYLELLWVNDEQALRRAPISNTRLADRAQWKTNNSSPFGIALRSNFPFETWDYCPPYLPEGMSIPVAQSSLDPEQPFIFKSPGGKRPDVWSKEKPVARQNSEKFKEIVGIELDIPCAFETTPDLLELSRIGLISLDQNAPAHAMRLTLSTSENDVTHCLELPSCLLIAAA